MNIVPITIWREARGEGHEGMVAVAHVMLNRAKSGKKQWPDDPEMVCLQKRQFSCWNDADPERDLFPSAEDPKYQDAQRIWEMVANGEDEHADPTNGAEFYINVSTARINIFANHMYEMVAKIGNHTFYKQVV